VVVSDLRMPDLDGPSLWRELSATRPDLAARMLFLTGDTLSGTARAFLHEANAPVLDKPLDLDELRRRIGELAGIAAAAR
jgi:CheY-like chemotaxis protein